MAQPAFAPVYRAACLQGPRLSAPARPAVPTEGAEAALVDLKDQIGSLRKDLHEVRSNMDQKLKENDALARHLRLRMPLDDLFFSSFFKM